MNILCIGDVVGKPGRRVLADHLPGLIRDRDIDLVVCNAENAAGGSGLTPAIFKNILHCGVDVVTLGDHVFRKREIVTAMADSDRIVRPANLSPTAAGRRWTVVPTKSGDCQVGVACLLGQLYMNASNSPWTQVDQVLHEMPPEVKVRVIDFHAEASSEKIAIGWHLAGRVSVVFGTHTHIPTADARVLDGGTAHISDVGMTGPYDGILGRRKDRVLYALTTSMPTPFDVATDDVRLCAVLVTVDPVSGKATAIERIEVQGTPDAAQEGNAETPSNEVAGESSAEPA
ncbi:MAG TPA: TIGR00282 family metallophosphoesterase [Phycisphaerae bacterium]|nr:TIGR00282 family metallophosphoesterase [Phycisphaerae bacterium]